MFFLWYVREDNKNFVRDRPSGSTDSFGSKNRGALSFSFSDINSDIDNVNVNLDFECIRLLVLNVLGGIFFFCSCFNLFLLLVLLVMIIWIILHIQIRHSHFALKGSNSTGVSGLYFFVVYFILIFIIFFKALTI